MKYNSRIIIMALDVYIFGHYFLQFSQIYLNIKVFNTFTTDEIIMVQKGINATLRLKLNFNNPTNLFYNRCH